ncbi:hypothetical protein CVIRNUC_008910 [Coccomyxa viridis]|uniref:Ferritin n=1 Tax=Coccomyxa viridis TaxID=1274662 RepID=A0AAV1IEB7_9CHLO|nr:hypothetical protein CVIRNUC_008910 [Coccomyxa viridis]
MQALRASMACSAMASLAPCRHGRMMASASRVAIPSASPAVGKRSLCVTRAQAQDVKEQYETAEHKGIVFKPMKAGKEQLEQVASAHLTSSSTDDSLARLNFAAEQEVGINEQINHEYAMSYQYHAMSNFFNRDNVGLQGFAAFYRVSSLEERAHAQQLMDYQATRGGRVKLAALAAPPPDYNHEQKGDALYSMEIALALEKLNFQMLYSLHETADKAGDAQMTDFVEEMLAEQADAVKEISDFVAKLRRVGKGLGVYEFDQLLATKAQEMYASLPSPV